MIECTEITPPKSQHNRRRIYPRIEGTRPITSRMDVWRQLLPLSSGQPSSGVHPVGFTPSAITVRNYTDQGLYLATGLNDPADILAQAELVIPPRTVYNAPFGIRAYATEFGWSLPGTSYGRKSMILAYIYEDEMFSGDDFYQLPPDLSPNALETYEKSSTIVAGLTPGGSLAAGAFDEYTLAHASLDLTVAADAMPMQFVTGATSAHVSNQFTLYPGEARSLGARYGYVKVTNLGAGVGGYRILNLYVSQTL